MKNRTLNEIRQSKEYQIAKETVGKYEDCTGDVKTGHAAVALKELKGENFYKNPFSHADVDKTVETIVEKLDGHMYDLIFQAVCDEMNNHYVFDSTEYLTQAGLELFEDEWFEFYHENHGKIIHKLLQNLK
jgi:uncharacterized protein YpuA (DUF1002 family)